MIRYDMARPGWQRRRRDLLLAIVRVVVTALESVLIAIGVWLIAVAVLALGAPTP